MLGTVEPQSSQLKGFTITAEQVKVGIFIFMWYSASSLSNNSNKFILSIFPRPMFLTLAQLAFVFLFSAIYLSYKGQFRIFPKSMQFAILPLAFANFFTHVLAYIALKDIAVSFINTIKVQKKTKKKKKKFESTLINLSVRQPLLFSLLFSHIFILKKNIVMKF